MGGPEEPGVGEDGVFERLAGEKELHAKNDGALECAEHPGAGGNHDADDENAEDGEGGGHVEMEAKAAREELHAEAVDRPVGEGEEEEEGDFAAIGDEAQATDEGVEHAGEPVGELERDAADDGAHEADGEGALGVGEDDEGEDGEEGAEDEDAAAPGPGQLLWGGVDRGAEEEGDEEADKW